MALGARDQIAMWEQVLRLCRLRVGEAVVLLVGPDSLPENARAAGDAVLAVGARLARLELGQGAPPKAVASERTAYFGPTALTGNLPAVAAMKSADLVIDLMGIDRGTEQQEILDSGTRILLVKEPPEVLARLVPTEDDRRRVLAAATVLGQAREMHVTSAAGTDLRVRLGQYSVLTEYGLADEPGRWDHWPSGFLATWPNEGSAQGTVVIDSGDIILPFKDYVRSPIRLTVAGGYIRAIDGGFDADFLSEYMASFADPEGYAVSHLGWGLQDRALWTALRLYDKRQTNAMDARSFLGNFMFSTGPNLEGGGSRSTPCHLDIPMRRCSLALDGVPMTIAGRVVPADQQARTAA
ncbi:MAG: 2,5-dihydroxypyridine 5,6-dioxygenase [Alphaproteobacteria bacterium]|nr:2,5-dihydroxypyridine 5,6-dioxygenase [Alphaproteobacteria bacterium]